MTRSATRAQEWQEFWEATEAQMAVTLLISASWTSAAGPVILQVQGELLSEPIAISARASLYRFFSHSLQTAALLDRISCWKCRKPHRPETKRHSRYCLENTCKMLETTTSYTCSNIYCRWVCALQSVVDFHVDHF